MNVGFLIQNPIAEVYQTLQELTDLYKQPKIGI